MGTKRVVKRGPGGGRKKKASALKMVENVRFKGNPDEPPVSAEMPRMPASLSPSAKLAWRSILPKLAKMGVIADVDKGVLASYAHHYGIFIDATKQMNKETLTVPDDKGNSKPNPLLGIINQALDRMQKAAVQFGLSPSSRAGLTIDTKSKEKVANPYEEWQRKKAESAEKKSKKEEG